MTLAIVAAVLGTIYLWCAYPERMGRLFRFGLIVIGLAISAAGVLAVGIYLKENSSVDWWNVAGQAAVWLAIAAMILLCTPRRHRQPVGFLVVAPLLLLGALHMSGVYAPRTHASVAWNGFRTAETVQDIRVTPPLPAARADGSGLEYMEAQAAELRAQAEILRNANKRKPLAPLRVPDLCKGAGDGCGAHSDSYNAEAAHR